MKFNSNNKNKILRYGRGWNLGSVVQVKLYFCLILLLQFEKGSWGVSWEEWWTYDGISGPGFWGLINPDWSLCNKGRRQSPINLEPSKLLYDPSLRPIHIDKDRVNGIMTNTGHSVIFYTGPWDEDSSSSGSSNLEGESSNGGGYGNNGNGLNGSPGSSNSNGISGSGPKILVNITGGPLSYHYQFHEIHIHYGLRDDGGSEHTVDGYAFPAELQMYGFNSQLYSNFSEAVYRSQGIVALSVLLQLGDLSNPELRLLTDQLSKIKYSGQSAPVQRLSLQALLPNTEYYMTYEGSTTMPACHETVSWIIMNKPIYITKQQLYVLRKLMQGDAEYAKAPLGSNFRPPQTLHHRPVRTNIDFTKGTECRHSMHKEMYYKANLGKSST